MDSTGRPVVRSRNKGTGGSWRVVKSTGSDDYRTVGMCMCRERGREGGRSATADRTLVLGASGGGSWHKTSSFAGGIGQWHGQGYVMRLGPTFAQRGPIGSMRPARCGAWRGVAWQSVLQQVPGRRCKGRRVVSFHYFILAPWSIDDDDVVDDVVGTSSADGTSNDASSRALSRGHHEHHHDERLQ